MPKINFQKDRILISEHQERERENEYIKGNVESLKANYFSFRESA